MRECRGADPVVRCRRRHVRKAYSVTTARRPLRRARSRPPDIRRDSPEKRLLWGRMRRIVLAVICLAVAVPAIAVAANPQKGGHYTGKSKPILGVKQAHDLDPRVERRHAPARSATAAIVAARP